MKKINVGNIKKIYIHNGIFRRLFLFPFAQRSRYKTLIHYSSKIQQSGIWYVHYWNVIRVHQRIDKEQICRILKLIILNRVVPLMLLWSGCRYLHNKNIFTVLAQHINRQGHHTVKMKHFYKMIHLKVFERELKNINFHFCCEQSL